MSNRIYIYGIAFGVLSVFVNVLMMNWAAVCWCAAWTLAQKHALGLEEQLDSYKRARLEHWCETCHAYTNVGAYCTQCGTKR